METEETGCAPGYRLITEKNDAGEIQQELKHYGGGKMRTLARWILDTREEGVRAALIRLGWTPPQTEDGAIDSKGPCAHCGQPVRHAYPHWTTHPERGGKPLHDECVGMYEAEVTE